MTTPYAYNPYDAPKEDELGAIKHDDVTWLSRPPVPPPPPQQVAQKETIGWDELKHLKDDEVWHSQFMTTPPSPQRSPDMSRKTIGRYYLVGIVGAIAGYIFWFFYQGPYQQQLHLISTTIGDKGEQYDIINNIEILLLISGIIALFGALSGLTAWVNTLINFSRRQQWAWVVLTFFFGGIGIFIYLMMGDDP